MKEKIHLLIICSLLASCTTVAQSPEAIPDKVIARVNNLSSRPDWLDETTPFKIESNKVTAIGSTTIPGDDRVEAAYRVADNNAKGLICSSIEQKLDFIFQNAEEGTSIDSTQVRFIGSEACKMSTSSVRSGKRYWEKIATTNDSGIRVTRYKVYSSVEMPESDFKKAVLNAIKKQEGKTGLSKDFSEKVDQQWDKFVDSNAGGKK